MAGTLSTSSSTDSLHSAGAPSSAAASGLSVSTTIAPAGVASASAPVAAPALSPKTSKLLRRIRRREEELEELSLENALLKEANRRANEEKLVREQEKRVEARKRLETEAAHAAAIAALQSKLDELTPKEFMGIVHDPLDCVRQIAELRELVQLREEQLELINLDRFKLYEEIETWKIGMEKLASLQGVGNSQAAQQERASSAAARTPVKQRGGFSAALLSPQQQQQGGSTPVSADDPRFLRSTSDYKEDSLAIEGRLMSHSAGSPAPFSVMQQQHAINPSASPVFSPSDNATPSVSSATPSLADSHDPTVEEIWENQQRHPFFGFQATSRGRFGMFQRYPFSDESGSVSREFESITLPPGWVWDEQWHVDLGEWQDRNAGEENRSASAAASSGADDKLSALRASMGLGSKSVPPKSSATHGVGTDANGWRYSIQFRLFAWHPEPGRLDTVRRRRWVRRRCWVGVEATEAMLSNALAAIAATRAAAGEAALALPPVAPADGSAPPSDSDDASTLAALAAAYSNDSGDSFSMFTSVAPPGVSSSQESAGTRALAALLQLGQQTQKSAPTSPNPPAVAAPADGTTSAVASTPPATSSASSSSSTSSVVSALGSYLASTRALAWVARRSSAAEPVAAPEAAAAASPAASSSAAASVVAVSSSAAPSPVCSFCAAPSRTALQFVSPSSSLVAPLASFCLPHYRQALRHILAELQLANPNPLTAAERERREREQQAGRLPPNLCAYCASLDTFPVQLLHLAAPDDSASPHAAASSGAASPELRLGAPLPSAVVEQSQETFRFCAAHMPAFTHLVAQFRPTTPTPITDSSATAEEQAAQHAAAGGQEPSAPPSEEEPGSAEMQASAPPPEGADPPPAAASVPVAAELPEAAPL